MNLELASVALVLSAFAFACSSASVSDNSGSSTQHAEENGPAEEGAVCDSSKGKDACEEGFECSALPEGSRFIGTICQAAPHEEGDFCMDDVPCAEGLTCTPPGEGQLEHGQHLREVKQASAASHELRSSCAAQRSDAQSRARGAALPVARCPLPVARCGSGKAVLMQRNTPRRNATAGRGFVREETLVETGDVVEPRRLAASPPRRLAASPRSRKTQSPWDSLSFKRH